MKKQILSEEVIREYVAYLHQEEYASQTIEKYERAVRAFRVWLTDAEVDREAVNAYKEYLQEKKYAPSTVNAILAALNGLFDYLSWADCRSKFLKIQHRAFRDSEKELSKNEYTTLVKTAKDRGNIRLALILETIGATGIRVSEVENITVEVLLEGRAEIALKGKIRIILLPQKLCRKLLRYAKTQKITAGAVFRTRNDRPLTRQQIWAEMKYICRAADISTDKVFPHNLRHLFAQTHYQAYNDIVKLADVLGHSSIETTRIYLTLSSEEHQKQLEKLGFVS